MDTKPLLDSIESELQRQIFRLDTPRTKSFHEMLTYHMGWTGEGAGPGATGKRIRPLLVLLCTAACGADWNSALPAAAAIELGHFLDNVEDDPAAAAKAFGQGITAARHLLIEGLLGQAKSLIQLDKREEAVRCLVEAHQLADAERPNRKPWFDWEDPSVPVGNSPPFPRWPLALMSVIWGAWVVFLVLMLIQERTNLATS